MNGWGNRIRTYIHGVRVRCPAVERSPSKKWCPAAERPRLSYLKPYPLGKAAILLVAVQGLEPRTLRI